jgi:hypothetical protein
MQKEGTMDTQTFGRATGAAAQLFELQIEQLRHDEKYHKEIARLTVQHRLNHMALHLAKYLGVIASAAGSDPEAQSLARAIVDSLIITLSTANILNLRISERLIERGKVYTDISALALHFAEQLERVDPASLVHAMAIPVGRMAGACEKADHLEAFPFRETLIDCVVEIAKVLLAAMAVARIDPAPAIRTRLQSVKERSIFHGHM